MVRFDGSRGSRREHDHVNDTDSHKFLAELSPGRSLTFDQWPGSKNVGAAAWSTTGPQALARSEEDLFGLPLISIRSPRIYSQDYSAREPKAARYSSWPSIGRLRPDFQRSRDAARVDDPTVIPVLPPICAPSSKWIEPTGGADVTTICIAASSTGIHRLKRFLFHRHTSRRSASTIATTSACLRCLFDNSSSATDARADLAAVQSWPTRSGANPGSTAKTRSGERVDFLRTLGRRTRPQLRMGQCGYPNDRHRVVSSLRHPRVNPAGPYSTR